VNQFLLALALESIFGINAIPYRLVVAQGPVPLRLALDAT
jgi:hypothetical protein